MNTLLGKTILVTGASRGIGAAVDKYCTAQGARVLPHASRASALTDGRFLYEDLERFAFSYTQYPAALR